MNRRALSRERALTLALFVGAILLGLALRTPTPQPADYCTAGNHVTITTTDARVTLNALECK